MSDTNKRRGADNSDLGLFPQITHAKKRLFLTAFAEHGVVLTAAELAGINRWTHYHWLRTDAVYAEAFEEAERSAITSLEDEARKRAIGGSDTLLIFLLKGLRPERYSDRQRITHGFESETDQELIERASKSESLRNFVTKGTGSPGSSSRN